MRILLSLIFKIFVKTLVHIKWLAISKFRYYFLLKNWCKTKDL